MDLNSPLNLFGRAKEKIINVFVDIKDYNMQDTFGRVRDINKKCPDVIVEPRNPLTDEQISSPLQVFGQAKKQINNIFVDIQDYVADASERMIDINKKCPDVIVENELKSIKDYRSNVKTICEVLTRDQMKVAFFGRTSNGKSTVVNAMLGEKVLPTGFGHTTHCFLQVERSQTGDAYLVTEGSNERRNVELVTQLAHALLYETRLKEEDLVHIYWPKDKCSLLRDGVVLVDSPGLAYLDNLDDLIKKCCIDADVFVLVADAKSSLLKSEKKFLRKVSSKFSVPNIFILNNGWDGSAKYPELIDESRKEIMKHATDFLVKELKVCIPEEEAVSRIFFISAEEVLQARVGERDGQALNSEAFAEGFSARYMEFEEFEHRLEECISKSAIKTKFLNHTQKGTQIVKEMYKIMDTIYNRSKEQTHSKMCQKKEFQKKLNFTEQQLICIRNQTRTKIRQMGDDIKDKVSKALNDEIRRLSVLVDEFNLPFHPETLGLNVYKEKLNSHVKSGLGNNLRAKFTTLATNIYQSQRDIINEMSTILPEDKRIINVTNPEREPFEDVCRLRCDNLCGDFHEQLEFKFPWGLSKLITRVSSLAIWSPNQSNVLIYPSHNPSTSAVGGSFSGVYNSLPEEQNVSMIPCVMAAYMGYMNTPDKMKNVVWGLIVAVGAVYGGCYLYQRLFWTTKAKEKEFKRQYVEHVTAKLRSIVDKRSKNCSGQVKKELSKTLEQLSKSVDESATNLKDEIKKLDRELHMLSDSTKTAMTLRDKTDLLQEKLKEFYDTFLSVIKHKN